MADISHLATIMSSSPSAADGSIDTLTKGEITTNVASDTFYEFQSYPDMILYSYDLGYQVIVGNSNSSTGDMRAGLYVKSNQVGIRTTPNGFFDLQVDGTMSCSQHAYFTGNMTLGPVDFPVTGTERLVVAGDTVVNGDLVLSSGMLFSAAATSCNTVLSGADGRVVVTFDGARNASFSGNVYARAFLLLSDRGAKKDIHSADDSISLAACADFVRDIPIVTFRYIADDETPPTTTTETPTPAAETPTPAETPTAETTTASETCSYYIGVIAQDIRSLVDKHKVPYKNLVVESADDRHMQTVDTNQLLMMTIRAVQHLIMTMTEQQGRRAAGSSSSCRCCDHHQG